MDQPAKQLAPGKDNLSIFEYGSTRYDAKIPQGVTVDELLDPAFWSHHAKDLRPFDEIRARADDGTWIAELIVLDCSRTWARVKIKHVYQLTTNDIAQTQASQADADAIVAAHEVKWRGPHKWSVVRKSDSVVVHEGEQEKEAAIAWLDAHARSQVGAPAKQPAAVPA